MTLRADLKRFRDADTENTYHRYHLLKNPFPAYGDTQADVCTDQEPLKRAVIDRLQNFEIADKRLRINGEYGAGKTNILQYFERLTDEARSEKLIDKLHPIYVTASGQEYMEMHGQIIDRLLERTLKELLVTLQNRAQRDELAEQFPSSSEVLNALPIFTMQLLKVQGQGVLFDVHEERKIDSFQRWLKGEKLSIQARKDIGDVQDISSTSLAIKFLRGYLEILRQLDICRGVVILIDEFEQIFVSVPRTKQSRYAQDIRHLADTIDPLALLIFATIPNPQDLGQYPAVERRLGEAIQLDPIHNIDLAVEYVIDYLRAGRIAFEEVKDVKLRDAQRKSLEPLSVDIIREVFEMFQTQLENTAVLPGYFLPEMRRRMKEIIEGHA